MLQMYLRSSRSYTEDQLECLVQVLGSGIRRDRVGGVLAQVIKDLGKG